MIQTTHYQLKKIQLTDAPPDITVINPNWDTIDAKMKELDTAKAAAAGHRADTTVHITAAERAAWNGKAAAAHSHDAAYAPISHSGDQTIHVTAADKASWNGKAAGSHNHAGVYAAASHAADEAIHLTAAERTRLDNLGSTDYVTLVVGVSGRHSAANVDFLADTTNAATAINNAIAALPFNGGCIQLLDGDYTVTETITLNKTHIWLRGVGSSTRLNTSTTMSYGIVRFLSPYCRVSDLRCASTTGWAMFAANSHAAIHDVAFISSHGGINVASSLDYGLISRCRFLSCSLGINVLGPNNCITGNVFANCSTAVYINAGSTVLGHNQLIDCGVGIEMVGGSRNQINGNLIVRGTGAADQYTSEQHTIRIASGCSASLIANNITAGKAVLDNSGATSMMVVNNVV